MTEEEYNKIKEAEKRRLRAKKRLQQLQKTSKRSSDAASLVEKMKRAGASLLRDTRSLVDKLSADVARSQARLEVALDDVESLEETEAEDPRTGESRRAGANADSLRRYEEAQREARADAIVRQMRASTQTASSKPSAKTTSRDKTTSRNKSTSRDTSNPQDTSDSRDGDASAEPSGDDLPDKTIGRMRRP